MFPARGLTPGQAGLRATREPRVAGRALQPGPYRAVLVGLPRAPQNVDTQALRVCIPVPAACPPLSHGPVPDRCAPRGAALTSQPAPAPRTPQPGCCPVCGGRAEGWERGGGGGGRGALALADWARSSLRGGRCESRPRRAQTQETATLAGAIFSRRRGESLPHEGHCSRAPAFRAAPAATGPCAPGAPRGLLPFETQGRLEAWSVGRPPAPATRGHTGAARGAHPWRLGVLGPQRGHGPARHATHSPPRPPGLRGLPPLTLPSAPQEDDPKTPCLHLPPPPQPSRHGQGLPPGPGAACCPQLRLAPRARAPVSWGCVEDEAGLGGTPPAPGCGQWGAGRRPTPCCAVTRALTTPDPRWKMEKLPPRGSRAVALVNKKTH